MLQQARCGCQCNPSLPGPRSPLADAVVHTIYHCFMFDAPPGWRVGLYWSLTYASTGPLTVSTDTTLQRSHQCLSRRQSAPDNLQFFRCRRHLPFATSPACATAGTAGCRGGGLSLGRRTCPAGTAVGQPGSAVGQPGRRPGAAGAHVHVVTHGSVLCESDLHGLPNLARRRSCPFADLIGIHPRCEQDRCEWSSYVGAALPPLTKSDRRCYYSLVSGPRM